MSASFRFIIFAVPVLLLALILVWTPRTYPEVNDDPLVEQAADEVQPAPMTPEQRELDREISRIGGTFPGHVGIAVRDIAACRTLHFNGLQLFPQQSVSKLWVTLTALDRVDAGKLDLSEMVEIRDPDLTVFYQPIRDIVRQRGSFSANYADLIERAITQSDNTANDRILRKVGGPDVVQKFLDGHGLSSIRFGTDERTKQSIIAGLTWTQAYSKGAAFFDARDQVPDQTRSDAFEAYLADPIDGAPPVAIVEALARLHEGKLLSGPSTALLLATMSRTRSGPQRLKAGAPRDWIVRHKTGTGQVYDGEQSGYNDIGLFTSPDGRTYAIAVLIARTRVSIPERMAMMQEVVRAVAQYDATVAQDQEEDGPMSDDEEGA